MANIELIKSIEPIVNDKSRVTKVDFVLPNLALILAINSESKDIMPNPGVIFGGGFIPSEAIMVKPDGRILTGRPRLQVDGCYGAAVYQGQRDGKDYKLSFYPITSVDIETARGVAHQPVIDEMVDVLYEAFRLKD